MPRPRGWLPNRGSDPLGGDVADDEHGDPYYFVPDGSAYGDGPVFVRGPAHGPDGEEQVAGSLAEFLSWSRDYAH